MGSEATTGVLAGLEAMPVSKRLRLGWFCAHWLARGMTVAALCDELGVVRQTGYRWMDELTELFGDRLYDPRSRMELQTGLAAALPAWQAEAANDPLEPAAPGQLPTGPTGLLGAGLDGTARTALLDELAVGRSFYPVVATDHVLDDALSALPGVRETGQPGEALVPAATSPLSLPVAEGSRLVHGPPAPIEAVGEVLRLVRRAADLLAGGHPGAITMAGDRDVVPLSDLAGVLIVAGTPWLTRFAVERHLTAMAQLTPRHRVQLAEALLDWLSTADPAHRIAERASVATNTIYSRLQRARTLLSAEALTDPYQRLELTVALHHVLPLWRRQAAR